MLGYKLAVGLCLTLGMASAMAQQQPPPRYENWGICPFECCTYREWIAQDDIPVHASRNDKSKVIFRVRKGELVDAVTGVLVTVKPGVIEVNKAVQDGYLKGGDAPQLALLPGDKIYMLSPLGEGSYLFWYQGKVYESGNGLAAMPGVDGRDAKFAWWKLVKDKAGRRGWTQSDKFGSVDACG